MIASELVDTHCHIHEAGAVEGSVQNKWRAAGIDSSDKILKNSVEAGVTRMVCVGCTVDDSARAVALAAQSPNCWASVGIHPHEAAAHNTPAALEELAALAMAPRVVAVGECGLDYFYQHSGKADQVAILEYQLQLALDHNLPVIFHVREAFDDFWGVLDGFSGVRGVLHSFTDTKQHMQRAIAKGLYVGVNGIATFTRQAAQREMFAAIPLERLVLETDAPFLTPAPIRGTINEPKNMVYTMRFLAELRGEDEAILADATTRNAIKLFGLE